MNNHTDNYQPSMLRIAGRYFRSSKLPYWCIRCCENITLFGNMKAFIVIGTYNDYIDVYSERAKCYRSFHVNNKRVKQGLLQNSDRILSQLNRITEIGDLRDVGFNMEHETYSTEFNPRVEYSWPYRAIVVLMKKDS